MLGWHECRQMECVRRQGGNREDAIGRGSGKWWRLGQRITGGGRDIKVGCSE